MAQALEKSSKITAKGQTTVPEAIRRALGVETGDRIAFRVERGAVTLHRIEAEHTDPAVGAFLDFLERDIARGNVQVLPVDLMNQIDAVLGDLDIDLDAPIDDDV